MFVAVAEMLGVTVGEYVGLAVTECEGEGLANSTVRVGDGVRVTIRRDGVGDPRGLVVGVSVRIVVGVHR